MASITILSRVSYEMRRAGEYKRIRPWRLDCWSLPNCGWRRLISITLPPPGVLPPSGVTPVPIYDSLFYLIHSNLQSVIADEELVFNQFLSTPSADVTTHRAQESSGRRSRINRGIRVSVARQPFSNCSLGVRRLLPWRGPLHKCRAVLVMVR